MKLPVISMLRIKNIYRIEFLTPFCNQKRYFAFFSFCLGKMFMTKQQQMTPPTIQGSRFGKSCWNEFLTPFCDQTLYFLFFSIWLHKTVVGPKKQFKLPTIWLPWIEKLVFPSFQLLYRDNHDFQIISIWLHLYYQCTLYHLFSITRDYIRS